MEGCRIVIAGPSGSGKSAVGNTIFGQKVFPSAAASYNVTRTCMSVSQEVCNLGMVQLVDTPSPLTPAERKKCLSICAPGPHVFLLTISVSRFTEEQKKDIESLNKMFGEEMYDHTIVLFTHRDNIEATGEKLQDQIENSSPYLQKLLEKCGHRYHIFDNTNKDDIKQVEELVQKIYEMVQANGCKHYDRVRMSSVGKKAVCTLFSLALLGCLWAYRSDGNIGPQLFLVPAGIGIILLQKFFF